MSFLKDVNINKTELGYDAWGRNKMVLDKSMFSGLFTYDVPYKLWKELIWDGTDYIEQTSFVNSISNEGALHFTSGIILNQEVELRSQEHFRYQANRGYLYSTSIILPDPNNNGIRRWGSILPCNGVFFELVGDGLSHTLNFVVRNHFIETRTDITSFIPAGTDLSKGNLWDYQMQWRGVGDIKLFLNQELIYESELLGTRTKVLVENPSLPVGFENINTGDEVITICGCVDISFEGGVAFNSKYTSFSTGETLIPVSNAGVAAIGIRMPYKLNYGGDPVCYSRDAILNQITSFCKDESVIAMYISRGPFISNLDNNLIWTMRPGEFIEYAIGGTGSDLDNAFQLDKANMNLIYSVRQEKDFAVRLNNPAYLTSQFLMTANSYLVVMLKSDAASTAGVTIEMSEQI